MENIMQYTQDFFAIVGGLYAFASLVGNLVPNTKVGQFFRKFAADLQTIEKLAGGTSASANKNIAAKAVDKSDKP